ncbi:outer membrane beta-barrel protein [Parafilimonas terrae]|nr:outer membrane beta-barrel protein [Parafilimonas terrae]
MKSILTVSFALLYMYTQAQFNTPRIEAYVAPGLFFEKLSNDELVPPKRREVSRLGDVGLYGLQIAVPLKNQRFTLKSGAGFSQRHYSLNKYSLNDLIAMIIPFGHGSDSFAINNVRFTNNYFQIPLSFSYTVSSPVHKFKLAFGLTLRPEFLLQSSAAVAFDSAYRIPQPADVITAKKLYTSNASKFLFTAESFVEGSFPVYKNTGMFFQFRPYSFYASPLDKRLTTSTIEAFSFTFGAFYSFK